MRLTSGRSIGMAKDIKDYIKCRNVVIGCTNNCPYCYARTSNRRFHIVEDFSKPVYFPKKVDMLRTKKPENYLVTGMSDLSDYKKEWLRDIFRVMKDTPDNRYVFLTKRPEKLDIDTDLNNVWIGVTVTGHFDAHRLDALRKNVRCPHLHVTFEPLHSSVGDIDLTGIDWIVIGTETGQRRGKTSARKEWVDEIVGMARKSNTRIFMKKELVPIIGEENIIQELPPEMERR